MANSDINYSSLSDRNPFQMDVDERGDGETDMDAHNDNEDTPRNSGVMIHIVPETSKARWNHIEDLDSFFTRMYNYHQKHGFTIIVLEEFFQLGKFFFVGWLLTFTVHCLNYPVLFGDEPPKSLNNKVTLSDVIIPPRECMDGFGGMTYMLLILGCFYFMIRLIKSIYIITQYSEIKKFYNTALHIDDSELDNVTWHEVKRRIREVQAEQHMCIDKEQLTELDIYHRILRFKNYMVALMNKNLLPVRFKAPILGEMVTLSRGLIFNIDFILFRGPGSPFQNNWQLRDDYTVRSNQIELAQRLSKLILGVAIANLVLAPFIFLWQLIYFSFSYANVLRKEPSTLGMRTWSNYGRLYLRHFNELDHELDARLNRAYEYSDRYLSSFSSPLLAVVAKNILFISGGILVVILALGIYQEFVFQVEHILTIITVFTAIGIVCRTLIPDENLIWCPEQLMTAILAHVHYLPPDWKHKAHTTAVRKEFENFFQLKAGYLLNEIFSPLTTPFILMFVFRPKSLEIVKFFRTFTVTVRGVGNVCSFAQMDVRKHGNPEWQLPHDVPTPVVNEEETKGRQPMENGKTELSLIRFTITNPDWQMPPDSRNFIKELRENAVMELKKTKRDNYAHPEPITESLLSFGTIGDQYSSIANSVFVANKMPAMANSSLIQSVNGKLMQRSMQIPRPTTVAEGSSDFDQMLQQNLCDASREPWSTDEAQQFSQSMITSVNTLENMRKLRTSKMEGCMEAPADSLIYSIHGIDPKIARIPIDVTVADMCLSTLYLHELHKRNIKSRPPASNVGQSMSDMPGTSQQQQPQQRQVIITSKAAEKTPLLGNIRS